MKKRRSFSRAFKREAVSMVLDQGFSAGDAKPRIVLEEPRCSSNSGMIGMHKCYTPQNSRAEAIDLKCKKIRSLSS